MEERSRRTRACSLRAAKGKSGSSSGELPFQAPIHTKMNEG